MGALIGIDWGCGAHAVCVLDAEGKTLDRFEVGHNREGLAALVARLGKHGPARAPPIAVERPSGLLVDTLIEAGFVVTPIHPNVVKACRPRYRTVAAKSDPGDAYILADILRTDGHRLRPLQPASDAIKALRGLVRGRAGPGPGPGRLGEPADRSAGELLARRRHDLGRPRQPDRARLPRVLSDARIGRSPRPQAPGRLPRPAPRLRPPRA